MIDYPRHKLHGKVLEREGRTVKQFKYKKGWAKLNQGSNSRVAKSGIGGVNHASQSASFDLSGDEWRKNGLCGLLIGHACKAADRIPSQLRIGLRQIKTAGRRKTGKQHLRKRYGRRRTAGRDVFHLLARTSRGKGNCFFFIGISLRSS